MRIRENRGDRSYLVVVVVVLLEYGFALFRFFYFFLEEIGNLDFDVGI